MFLKLDVLLDIIFLLKCLVECKTYLITTYTGNLTGAGTDANVFIKLNGDHGTTGRIPLASGTKDIFEKNEVDKFNVESEDIGSILSIEFSHDDFNIGSSWFLEKVTIEDDDGDFYEFLFNKWIENLASVKNVREHIIKPNLTDLTLEKLNSGNKSDNYGEVVSKQTLRPLACSKDLGMTNGLIQDNQVTASTSFNDLHLPFHARLGVISNNSYGGWCSFSDKIGEFLQINFDDQQIITGVATQGLGLVDEWTSLYSLSFKQNGIFDKINEDFYFLVDSYDRIKLFNGNVDQNSISEHWFEKPVIANSIRFNPVKWHGKACFRVGVFGCSMNFLNHTLDSTFMELNKGVIFNKSELIDSEKALSRSSLLLNLSNKLFHKNKFNQSTNHDLINNHELFDTTPFMPSLHLDFDGTNIDSSTVVDSSGKRNDAKVHKPADMVTISQSCGKSIRLNGGSLILDGDFFAEKPSKALTIMFWLKLFTNGGSHSIFYARSLKSDGKESLPSITHSDTIILSIIRGRINFILISNWIELCNLTSSLVIPSKIWTHVSVTYEIISLNSRVAFFVNGKLVAKLSRNLPKKDLFLPQDWSGGSFIGNSPYGYPLNGLVDEFYIYSSFLALSNINSVMRKCNFEIECNKPLGMENSEISDQSITASSTYNLHKPHYGRLNIVSMYGDPARTAWCPDANDKSPKLIIDLNGTKTITAIAIQGLSIFDNWVTSFYFCYSQEVNINSQWQCYKQSNIDKIFDGNSDKNSIKKHVLDMPIKANYVSFNPLTWFGSHMCMRVEVYGCISDLFPDPFDSTSDDYTIINENPSNRETVINYNGTNANNEEECNSALGIGSGRIDDTMFSASSELDNLHQSRFARIVDIRKFQNQIPFLTKHQSDGQTIEKFTIGCWCSSKIDWRQFVQVDLSTLMTIKSIALQGYIDRPYWIESFRIGHSDGSQSYHWYAEDGYEKIFSANNNQWEIVKINLKKSIDARFIRINPRSWHGDRICLRFELFGCFFNRSTLLQVDNLHSIKLEDNYTIIDDNYLAENIPLNQITSKENFDNRALNIIDENINKSMVNSLEAFVTSSINNLPAQKISNSSEIFIAIRDILIHLNQSFNNIFNVDHHMSTNDSKLLNKTYFTSKWHQIMLDYPSLLSNKITEDMLLNYSSKIKDLDKKIATYFNSKNQKNDTLMPSFFLYSTSATNRPVYVESVKSHKKHHVNTSGDVSELINSENIAVQNGTFGSHNKNTNSEKENYEWSSFSRCRSVCGQIKRYRYRLCKSITDLCTSIGSYERESQDCPSTSICPVLHYSFETFDGNVIIDDSGLSNNGYIDETVKILYHPSSCGQFIDFSKNDKSRVLLPTRSFRKKPFLGITIGCWIKFSIIEQEKQHEIFSAERMSTPYEFIGSFHLELTGRKIRWSHRLDDNSLLFNLYSDYDLMLKTSTWYHFTAVYDSKTKLAQFFLNGIPKFYSFAINQNQTFNGYLSTNWGFSTFIGHYDFDDRHLNGSIDDFFIFDRALSMNDIQLIMNFTLTQCSSDFSSFIES